MSSAEIHRLITNALVVCVLCLSVYMVFFDSRATFDIDDLIDIEELEQELDSANPVRIVSYKSPLDENLFRPWSEINSVNSKGEAGEKRDCHSGVPDPSSVARYNKLWKKADQMINRKRLWSNTPVVDTLVKAMQTACIVNVDVLDIGEYESGTGEKWIVTLEGGQKAVVKIVWEEKGDMKRGGLCNYGFEIPTAEIAAFHLHRVLGFYNTPFVSGRKIDLLRDILPVASPAVSKQIKVKAGNETCLSGTCYNCKIQHTMCPRDGIIEVSMSYWIPRKLRLYTYPIKYMPWSTPRMDEWESVGFNDRTYCKKVRETIEPYKEDQMYHDLFDFALLDTLMYHYDSKHYTINDNSEARGLTVRLDHGRAFCAYDKDEEEVFLAPIKQCCTLRKSTFEKLKSLEGGQLSKKLLHALSVDPLAPVLKSDWYPALDRRFKLIMDMVERCISANGVEEVLV